VTRYRLDFPALIPTLALSQPWHFETKRAANHLTDPSDPWLLKTSKRTQNTDKEEEHCTGSCV